MGLGKGSHAEIESEFRNKKLQNPGAFAELMAAVDEMCNGVEADVDVVLQRHPDLEKSFNTGAKLEVLLKVLKWMFIMEDIVYWNYDGRMKLYNYLREMM